MKQNYAKLIFIGLILIGFSNWGFGQNRNYLDFDGSSSYVKYANDSKLEGMNGAGNYTIEAWVYVDANCDDLADIMRRNNQFLLYYRKSTNSLGFGIYTTKWYYYHSTDNSLSSGGWHHIAVVRNTSLSHYLHIYIDGTDVIYGSYNAYSLKSSNTYHLYIGNDGSGGHYYKGYIDEVRLSAAATSSSSLHSNTYDNQYVPNSYTKALFHFNEGTGTATVNEAYSTSNVTVNGATWTSWSAHSHLPLAYEWTGGSTDWANTGNWASGSIPTATTDILIPDKLNDPIIGSSTNAVTNNLYLETSASLTANTSSTLTVSGEFTNKGAFTDNGTTKFDGSLAQTIPAAVYNNLTIDNTNGVTLGGAVAVKGILTLTNGIINTTSTNLLTINDGGSVSGGSEANHVEGPMAKVGDGNFIFQTGDGGKWARIGISNLSASETFTAEYHKATPANNTTFTAPLTKVSDNEYWVLERAGNESADVTFYWQDSKWSGIGNFDDLRLGHWNNNTSKWEEVSGTYSHTGSASLTESYIGSLKVTGVSSFSPFAPASINNTTNTLPVELISFELTNKASAIELNWQTASELNNDGFEIQRSDDTENWQTIGFVKGAGSSNMIQNYSFVDNNPAVFNYYRLKQIDFDGAFEFSDIKFLKLGKALSISSYPNPVVNVLNMDIDDANQINIYDVAGKLIQQYKNISNSIDVSNLRKGVYFFIIEKNDGSQARGEFMKN